MALELVFECPRKLRNLRSGPLGRFLEGFCHWLLESGFTRGLVRKHISNVAHLTEELTGPTAAVRQTINSEDVELFFNAYPSRCRNRGPLQDHCRRVRYSINRFTDYLRQKGLFDPQVQPPIYQPLLDSYLEWMRDYQHAAPGTLGLRRHCLAQFLDWLSSQATVEGLSELTADRVEEFFIAYAQGMGRATRRSMQSALRTFLRFCFHEGYIPRHLDQAVPTLRTYKLATVPRGLSEAQSQTILRSVDRRTDAGRRDYAILRLLHTYGVRGGQVRALRLEDIHWTKNQILFKASKNGKDSLLPLTAEVGKSLLDYLRNARPRCYFPEVFLTCRAPYHRLADSHSLSEIVRRHIRSAGIESPCKGSHVFRHGFATRMVEAGHSLKAIADVLGHRHLSTTFIYTKVDFNALKQVALEWPEEVS